MIEHWTRGSSQFCALEATGGFPTASDRVAPPALTSPALALNTIPCPVLCFSASATRLVYCLWRRNTTRGAAGFAAQADRQGLHRPPGRSRATLLMIFGKKKPIVFHEPKQPSTNTSVTAILPRDLLGISRLVADIAFSVSSRPSRFFSLPLVVCYVASACGTLFNDKPRSFQRLC